MKSCILRGLCASLVLLSGAACDDDNNGGGNTTPQESAPTAVAVALQTVNEGTTVTLDATASHDLDGNITGYAWTQTAGDAVTLTGANSALATFVAPNVGDKAVLRFTVAVTDATGLVGTDDAEVDVLDLNAAPAVTVPVHLAGDALTQITLTGTAVDLDGSVASVAWTEAGSTTATLTNATTLSATATLPDVDQQRELIFRLSATDNEGKVGYAEVPVTVNPVAAKLRLSATPGTALRNTAWGSFSVEIMSAGNPSATPPTPSVRITGGDAAFLPVTIVAKAGGPAGNLVGTVTVNAVAGIARFTNVMFDTVTPTDNGVIVQATTVTPAITSPDSSQVKITWPGKIPGMVAAPTIAVNAVALVLNGSALDVIIGGSFTGTDVSFDLAGDTTTTYDAVAMDGFVARYSGADGSLTWARTFTNTLDSWVTGLAVANNGQIFVAVDYEGVTDFARDGQTALQTRAHGDIDIAVARLTSTGWTEWLQDIGGPGDDMTIGLALDGSSPQQHPIIGGKFQGEVNFNPDGSGAVANSTAVDGTDAFAMKLGGAAGAYTWHYVTGLSGVDEGTALMVRRTSSALTFLAGHVGTESFFVQLNSSGAANTAGIRTLTGGSSLITGVACDSLGKLFFIGDFSGTVDFNADTAVAYPLTSGSAGTNRDLFLISYESAGAFAYATKLSGTGDIFASKLAYRDGTTDSLIITGQFTGSLDFDPTAGEKRVTVDSQAMFVLSLDPLAQFDWVGVIDPTDGFSADAMAVTTTATRIGLVGWTQSDGGPLDFDLDPNLATTVPVTLPATSQAAMIVKMDEKGHTVP